MLCLNIFSRLNFCGHQRQYRFMLKIVSVLYWFKVALYNFFNCFVSSVSCSVENKMEKKIICPSCQPQKYQQLLFLLIEKISKGGKSLFELFHWAFFILFQYYNYQQNLVNNWVHNLYAGVYIYILIACEENTWKVCQLHFFLIK